MNILPPRAIDGTSLISSSVAENDYPSWSAGAAYVTGGRCIVAATHKIYEALQASTNQYPPNTIGVYWVEVSATNRWAMFDGKVGTQTVAAESITVHIASGALNTVGVLNVDADSVLVVVRDKDGNEVYRREIIMNSSAKVVDWYTYFFMPVDERTTDLVLTDIPLWPLATLEVTISAPGGTAACGILLFGSVQTIGTLLWSPEVSIIDYSRKEVDEYGNPTLTVRGFAKLMSADVHLETRRVAEKQRLLAKYRATPLLWIGCTDFESTIVYGFYRSFSIVISRPTTSDMTLEVEGLI